LEEDMKQLTRVLLLFLFASISVGVISAGVDQANPIHALDVLPAPVIDASTPATGTIGLPFNYTIKASNGPTSYTVLGLPEGLSVDPRTGKITGTPTAEGTILLTLGASNTGGVGIANLILTINSPAPDEDSTDPKHLLKPPPDEQVRKLSGLISDANNKINFISQREEEWGWVQTSNILAIPNNENLDVNDPGKFPEPTSQYVTESNKEQAQAVTDVKDLARFMFSANAGNSSASPAITGTAAQPSAVSAPNQTTNSAVGELANTASTSGFGLSDRESMMIGVNDALAAKLLALLADPPPISGRRLYLGIFQVSCQPGWRTREHYKAIVNIRLNYAYKKPSQTTTREDSLYSYSTTDGNGAPGVYAVLPLLDDQVQGLQGSQSKTLQLFAQVAALMAIQGHPVQAQALGEYIHQVQQAQRTITPVPIISSFSNQNTFGFTFSPGYQALEDPRSDSSKAENVLYPTSFPAVVLMLLDDHDLNYIKNDSDKNSETDGTDNDPQRYALQVTVTHNWMLTDRNPIFPRNRYNGDSREEELQALVQAQYDTLNIHKILTDDEHMNPKKEMYEDLDPLEPYYAIHRELYDQVLDLESKSIGRSYASPLPTESVNYAAAAIAAISSSSGLPINSATVTEVEPHHGWQNQETVVLIQGTDLYDVTMVTFAGLKAQILAKNNNAIIVKVPPVNFSQPTPQDNSTKNALTSAPTGSATDAATAAAAAKSSATDAATAAAAAKSSATDAATAAAAAKSSALEAASAAHGTTLDAGTDAAQVSGSSGSADASKIPFEPTVYTARGAATIDSKVDPSKVTVTFDLLAKTTPAPSASTAPSSGTAPSSSTKTSSTDTPSPSVTTVTTVTPASPAISITQAPTAAPAPSSGSHGT
jgi:hypothetical protein